MSKYLELFKGTFDDSIGTKTKLENKPYIGYSLTDGKLAYTVIPKPVTGPADNEIWYTTVDGATVTPKYLSNFGAGFVENVYEDGKGILRFNGPVTHIPGNSNSRIGGSDAGAFRYCSSLTSVTIPDGVTSIGEEAFYGCSSLISVTIGESVTSIGSSAFSGCSKLTSVTINSDAFVNKFYAYNNGIFKIFGSQVTEYIIGDDVKGIGDQIFAECRSLTSVTIGNSVTSIGDSAFFWCTSLGNIVVPNSVTSIKDRAFENCISLTSITIPNSVTSIGYNTFYYCTSLASIIFEGTVYEWNVIEKGESWNSGTLVTYVQCTDGRVEL